MLNAHIACCTCGYDLVAQSAGARCPECGTSVMQSLRGPWLIFQPVPLLRQLGIALLVCGLSICAVWASVIWMVNAEQSRVPHIAATAAWLAMLGCGLFIAPRAAAGMGVRLQTLARRHAQLSVFMLGWSLFGVLVQAIEMKPSLRHAMTVVQVVHAVGIAVWAVGLLAIVAMLLHRAHSYRLAQLASWLAALVAFAAAVGAVGFALQQTPLSRQVSALVMMVAGLCGLVAALGSPIILLLAGWHVLRGIPSAAMAQQAAAKGSAKAEHPAV